MANGIFDERDEIRQENAEHAADVAKSAFDKLARDCIDVCQECFNRDTMEVVGMTGSWGPAMCPLCSQRQVSLVVKGKPQ